MKTKTPKSLANISPKKPIGKLASEAEFLAEKNRRFQEVFGKVDWDKARREGLIR